MLTSNGLRAAALAGGLALTFQGVANLTGASTGTGAPAARGAGVQAGTGTGQTRHVRAVLRDVHGDRIGRVDITALRDGGNEVSVLAWNLTPGFHGFHIHAVGACDPSGAKPFASAGDHFNPTGVAEGQQAGAFPVLLAAADGRVRTSFFDSNFAIGDLSGPKGASVVVHSAPDNYANIPSRYTAGGVAGPDLETRMTGDSGTRVACAVAFPDRRATTAAGPSPAASPTPQGAG